MGASKSRSDYILISMFALLIIFGLWMLSSAGVAVGIDRFNDPYFFVKRQFFFGLLPGIVAFLVAAKIPFSWWRHISFVLFICAIILLILVFIPGLGVSYDTGARSWLRLFGISFQPAEVMKLCLILYMAAYLAKMKDTIKDFSNGLVPILGMSLIPVLLVALQPDIGTTAILCTILMIMLFVANVKISHLSLLVCIAGIAFWLMIMAAPYRAERLMTFLHPELDPQGQGYHINQAFLAIGSGGWFGRGLGHSLQKFQYLPEVHADSIFAVIAEEMGFLVIVFCLVLIVAIAWRGSRIAMRSDDDFSKFVVIGISSWFVVQSLLNIGAIVGLLPLTGVPLPFVSHGGTSLLINMFAAGMIIQASTKII